MDENNEVLTAVKQGFERIDQRLGRIEGDVSGLKADVSVLTEDTQKTQLKLEFLIDRADLIKENVVDLRTRMTRYDTDVEHPLEQRVAHLEARSILEKKK
jgi:hypothetical protein